MKVDKYKNIELITVYAKMQSFPNKTYTTRETLAKVKQGKEYVYLMPYGENYECEGGHHIEILSQAEFDYLYSLELLK